MRQLEGSGIEYEENGCWFFFYGNTEKTSATTFTITKLWLPNRQVDVHHYASTKTVNDKPSRKNVILEEGILGPVDRRHLVGGGGEGEGGRTRSEGRLLRILFYEAMDGFSVIVEIQAMCPEVLPRNFEDRHMLSGKLNLSMLLPRPMD